MSWIEASLGDLISYIGKGIAPKYTEDASSPNSVLVLGQKCVRNQKIDYSQGRYHDKELKVIKPAKIAAKGDILINATGVGSAGRIAQIIHNPQRECVTDGHVITLRASSRINPYYLGYFIKSKQTVIEQLAEGSTGQTEMNRSRLQNEIFVTFPESDEDQRRIAEFGLVIDKKIAQNAKLNGYLEELCECLAAHESGTKTEIMQLCSLVSEKVPCNEAVLNTYVSTESLLSDKRGRQRASSLPRTGKVTVYRSSDVLISNIRPYFKKIWFADCDGTCSGDVLVFRAKNPLLAPYLYSILHADSFFEFVMKGAKGTKMPRGDKRQMLTYQAASSPRQDTIASTTILTEQIAINDRENDKLTALRDVILPKLMSGEIDVSKIDFTQLNSHLVQRDSVRSKPVDDVFLDQSFSLRAGANICSFTCR